MNFFIPRDLEAMGKIHGGLCGPASLAAIMGIPVEDAITRLGFGGKKSYTSSAMMREALTTFPNVREVFDTHPRLDGPGQSLPPFGLAFIQFSGGWWDDKPPRVQYLKTHWLAAQQSPKETYVFDANLSGWVRASYWVKEFLPVFCESLKCTGAYVRLGLGLVMSKGC